MKVKILATLSISLIIIFMLSACKSGQTQPEENVAIKVAAASDLSLAFTEIGALFKEETGATITFSFGSTGQLADQIENGAPFDVFAAANIKFIDQLKDKDIIIPETQTTYAFGRIGIATLPNQLTTIKTVEDLLQPEVIKVAIANPDHAPYGLAAKQALIEAGIWEQLQGKLVFGRNISDTLALIDTGNVEASIIALSLYQEGKVDFHLIDENLHAPLEQSIAVVNRTNNEELSKRFIDFIIGPIGKPIMESYGFVVPE
ncbi:molybdate ABC transporter substrate-binding protein [Alkalihalobacillus sp. BA299]|uniref:molybdate ABC transporter substrate-binding protein n=1 Tax=Alkalihalobacillus sp. BA299 TaxID=2815938 RepID=UPI001AD982B5|nr:molybdate ABC transporter substrate-binding protein [Alkalihalobacillus sp. BA299]